MCWMDASVVDDTRQGGQEQMVMDGWMDGHTDRQQNTRTEKSAITRRVFLLPRSVCVCVYSCVSPVLSVQSH